MKKFIVVLSIISILFLAGCNLNADIENSNAIETSKNQIQNETSGDLSEVEAKTIIENYLNLQGEIEGSYESFLESLELVDEVNFDKNVTIQAQNGVSELWKTNIRYEEFKEKLLTYMSLNRFETFTKGFEEKNGYLYTLPLGATGYAFELQEIELKEKNDKQHVYTVKAICYKVELIKEYTIEAILIEENGNFVLDSYEYIQVQNSSLNENSTFSNEQLIEMVKKYREARGEYIPEFIIVEDETNNIVTIHLYDIVIDHTATSDWYYINRNSGIGEDFFGERIDLNNIKEQENNTIDKNLEKDDKSRTDFEERTASFYSKKNEISGDRLSQEFNNIRLYKVGNNYELKADLIGAVKIETAVLENAIEQIKEEKLEKIEVEIATEGNVTIYSSKPKEIIVWHENEKNNPFYNELDFYEGGVLTYDDDDWIKAQSDAEWLDKNGIPMYVEYDEDGGFGGKWARLSKQEDGYYLITRDSLAFSMIGDLDTETGLSPVHGPVEKDAISINLLADDKIVLDINDCYGTSLSEDFKPTTLTVEEYYNLSPKDGTAYVTEDNLAINISNMSDSNYYNIGLEIKDGAIYVIARCDGP